MFLERERNYGLGMGCCAAPYALEARKELRFGHWVLMVLGMDAAEPRMLLDALGTRREVWLGHGCSGDRMLLEHERNYGLGMDAHGFGHGCCGAPYALGTRMEVWLGHGCSGDRMLLEHVWNYGLGMDAAGPQERTKWEENRECFSRRSVEFCAFRGTSEHALYSTGQLAERAKPDPWIAQNFSLK